MRKVGVFVLAVKGVVDCDPVREKSLGGMQYLTAVSSVAVLLAMGVEEVLELDVVSLGRVVGGRCEAPAHVHLAGCIAVTSVFVHVVAGDLVELPSRFVGDVFDDFGVGVRFEEVVAEDGLVKGEDAFDLDAEGDLEGGVDHVDGGFWL